MSTPNRDQLKEEIANYCTECADMPQTIAQALKNHVKLLDALDGKGAQMRRLLCEYRKALGIEPKSEKRGNYGKKKSKRERLEESLEGAHAKKKKHQKHARAQNKKAKEIEQRLKELDEIEFSAEEQREFELEDQRFDADLARGNGRLDDECTMPAELLFSSLIAEHDIDHIEVGLSEEQRQGARRTFTQARERLDVDFVVTTQVLEVEKAEVKGADGEFTIVSASTEKYGPPGMQVSWRFLSNLTIMVAQYAMPLNRFAKLVSTPDHEITTQRMSDYFQFVAGQLLDVYLELAKELANSEIISGDDTQTKTLEVIRGLRNNTPTWSDYATPQRAAESTGKRTLACQIAKELCFVSRNKTTGKAKRQFNTTVAHARSVADDPCSTIVFFRSHFGSFGDFVAQLLDKRDHCHKKLTILSDLMSTNFVSSEVFDITHAGCTAHARRRFVKADDGDEEYKKLCIYRIDELYSYEECLDAKGRNSDNTRAIRQGHSRKVWQDLYDDCTHIASKCPASTSLGEAARYLTNNFKTLTTHLDDPRLPHTNDLSERLIRPEKQIQAAALFRNSIEGRVAMDINRTIIQTCQAAEVNPAQYLQWVMRSDRNQVAQQPQMYTPYAFAKI